MCRNFFYTISIFIVLLSTTACNKWLTVNPNTQTAEAEQFSNQQGFEDVLWGSYQKAVTDSSYGKNLSFGLLEILAQNYTEKTSTSNYYGYAARYNYTSTSPYNVQSDIANLWSNNYGVIAQVNYILANIDAHQSVFSGNAYNLIKGESLALRAYMHFDLLRLFGPSYAVGKDVLAIPYMTKFTVKPQEKLSVQQVMDSCIADLKQAQELLSVDQSIDQIADNQDRTDVDLLTGYRQNHLNYWAVKAELARVYQYGNQNDSALVYATSVINSGKFSFITQSAIVSDPSNISADLTFSQEHIFSLYKSYLKTDADYYFKTTGTTPETSDFYSTQTLLNALYEATLTGYGTDVRSPNASKSLWYQISTSAIYTKKFWFDNATNVREGLIPLIKLAEMYYIAAESSSTVSQGLTYLNAVRNARLLPSLSDTIDATTFQSEIQKEYRKEFYGEGQLFFYYKRRNVLNIPNTPGSFTLTADQFILPYPLDEIEYGL